MPDIKKVLLACLTMFFLASCVGTKTGAYRVFTEDLILLVGMPMSEAYIFNIGHLNNAEPTETLLLPNGNKRIQYNYSHGKNNGYEACQVFLEVSGKDGTILSASSGGVGCWRVY